MAITIVLLAGFLVPIAMAVACVVIARHFYPPGSRILAGLAGSAGAIGLPVAVILAIRNWTALHDRLPGELGPFVSIVLFAAASVVAPVALLWYRRYRRHKELK
jgi:hypothetical protein